MFTSPSFTSLHSLARLALILCLYVNTRIKPADSQPAQQQQQQPHCVLGNDTFQIGERWNPILDPFGVQVCILCECTIRQRKSCYEARTTCRKITHECPIIDSCPDGKLPVTVTGQCCKSCVTTATANSSQADSTGERQPANDPSLALVPSVSYEDQTTQLSIASAPLASTQTSILAFRILYVNERTKDYLSMVRTLQPCPSRDAERPTSPAPAKSSKRGRNDLNGIDSRLAFKSLHESHQLPSRTTAGGHDPTTTTTSGSTMDMHDHQHPNDVQPTGSEMSGGGAYVGGPRRFRPATGPRGTSGNTNSFNSVGGDRAGGGLYPLQPTPNMCVLGDDTFQIGDIWHPILPPLGVQDCVQCNCVVKTGKNCFEPKVTCRRLEEDCPKISLCPDGRKPTRSEGQCCETCQSADPTGAFGSVLSNDPTATSFSDGGASSISNQILIARGNSLLSVRKNETILREFRALPRAMQSCLKRDNSNSDAWQAPPPPTKRRRRRHQSSTS